MRAATLVAVSPLTVVAVTDWEQWTAIGTLTAAAATLVLAAITLALVFATRGSVDKAAKEIAITRDRWRCAEERGVAGMKRLGVIVALLAGVASIAATETGALPVTPRSESPLRIIFPEGFSARQMADRVAAVRRIAIDKRHITPQLTGRCYTDAVRQARAPREFATQLKRRSVEGFLFPALYEFSRSTTATELVARQIAAFQQRWRAVDLRPARARGRTAYDVLTIASMVEREAVAPEERALVAAVIYNRLDRDMTLGIDATLRYGLGIQGTRTLTKAHFRSRSPYNTRRFKGLPPTPIGNPGLASIRAAARPANVDYLYYVRKPDRIHHFFTADDEEFCDKAREYGYSC